MVRPSSRTTSLRFMLWLGCVLVFAATFFVSIPQAHATAWYNTAWSDRNLLTVNASQVSSSSVVSSTYTNFTVLVGFASSTQLKTGALASGSDILFTNSDGVTLLNFEIERYVSSTGELEAWVKLPTLATSTNTSFYIYYDNPSSTVSLQSATNTWDSNYLGVWHFPNGTALSAKDSTVNANNGTIAVATATAGQVDGAASFVGSSSITTPYVQQSSTAATYEAWIKVPSSTTNVDVILSDRGSGAGHSLTLALDGNLACGSTSCGGTLGTIGAPTGKLMFGDDSNGIWIGKGASSTVSNDNNWHFVVGTWAAASGTAIAPGQFNVYVDGAMVASSTSGNTGADTSPLSGLASTTFGFHAAWNAYFTGSIDEARISKIVRPFAWIQTEYNDEKSPSTFISVATQENPPSFTLSGYRWFANIASTSVGSPLAVQNATATAQLVTSSTFRLRELIRVAGSQVDSSTQSFNLQYVEAGTGSCTSPAGGNPAAYTNVATSSGLFEYFNNAVVTDGSPLTPTSTDPVDGTSTIVNQTYEEANPFTNTQGAIPVGEDGKWDLSLVDNGAKIGSTYCFRTVTASGTVFSSYAFYPQIVIGEVAPVAGPVTLNGNSSIALTVGTTTLVEATATVSDANGYADLSTTTATVYRTSLGSSCTASADNCYRNLSCSLSSCFATACVATCNANIEYFAEPTDSGTPWTGDSWSAAVQASDMESETSSVATSSGVTLLSLLGFQLSTSTINYGSLSPGQGIATLTIPTTITSLGNVSLDMTLYGTNLTSGANSVSVNAEEYATSSVSYASGTPLLANPGSTVNLNIPKTTTAANPASSTFDWGVLLPFPQSSGNYTGFNTFVGVENSLPWP